MTRRIFNERLCGHTGAFTHEVKRNSFRLSQLIWELKDEGIQPTVTWSRLARAPSFSPATRRCLLCATEKYFIIEKPETASINKKHELYSHCRCMDHLLLSPHNTKEERERRARREEV